MNFSALRKISGTFAVAAAALSLAACQGTEAPKDVAAIRSVLMERFDSCVQGRYTEQDYIAMAAILNEMTAQMDVNKDDKINYQATKEQIDFPEKSTGTAFKDIFDAQVKLCFGPQEQAVPVSYNFFSRSILVGRALPPESAAREIAAFITSKPASFWQLKGPDSTAVATPPQP